MALTAQSTADISLWHQRCGHPTAPTLRHILTSCNVPYSTNKFNQICCACQLAKSHKLPFPLFSSRASQSLALIHANLWGPAHTLATNGAKYFLVFVDDFSRFSWIYMLHSKDQVSSYFVQFQSFVEKQFELPIECL